LTWATAGRREPPVVLDIATSFASYGTIRQYQIAGTPMPDGWVVHKETGKPVNDPKKTSEGVLLPIGGHKGSGIALMIGLLAGVLNGAAFARDVVDATGPGSGPSNTGQFVLALDVSRFMPADVVAAEVDRQLGERRSSPRLPGVEAIRIPGEDRRRRHTERSTNGVQLPPTLIKQLEDLAGKLKIAPLSGRSR
jgi:LDH2 family malate/lactate/ureidoglycolate dehydrogenase